VIDQNKEVFLHFLENEVDSDIIDVFLSVSLSKKVIDFIIRYCNIINSDPSEFFYSLIMHSIFQLINNVEDDEKLDVLKTLG
jgi:hypothetical protein